MVTGSSTATICHACVSRCTAILVREEAKAATR